MEEIVDTASFQFKEPESMLELAIIHPILLFIFADFNFYCYERNLPVIVTRAVDHDIPGVSVSHTHREGRALDLSVQGWDADQIDKAVEYFNNKYEKWGAISYSDGVPRALIYHNVGLGSHFHLQIRRFPRREQ